MDRGIPTEEVLAEMRASDPPVHFSRPPWAVTAERGMFTQLRHVPEESLERRAQMILRFSRGGDIRELFLRVRAEGGNRSIRQGTHRRTLAEQLR